MLHLSHFCLPCSWRSSAPPFLRVGGWLNTTMIASGSMSAGSMFSPATTRGTSSARTLEEVVGEVAEAGAAEAAYQRLATWTAMGLSTIGDGSLTRPTLAQITSTPMTALEPISAGRTRPVHITAASIFKPTSAIQSMGSFRGPLCGVRCREMMSTLAPNAGLRSESRPRMDTSSPIATSSRRTSRKGRASDLQVSLGLLTVRGSRLDITSMSRFDATTTSTSTSSSPTLAQMRAI